MAYIVVSSNEIVKAEMERPNKFAYSPHGYSHALNVFEKHCLPLPRISIEGKHDWEVWQSVEKGKDFIFIERCCVEFHVLGVSECESSDDDDNPCKCSVAIPIQPTPEGEKVEETKRVLLLTSYCGDDGDGCTSDFPCDDCLKMCNVVTIKESSILENLGGFDYNKFLLTNDNTQTP